MGAPYQCTRLRCFETTSLAERQSFLDRFNALPSKNEQDAMLASVVNVMTIKQRRTRREEDAASLHSNSYRYFLTINGERKHICFKVCLSTFDITKSRLERIQRSLTTTAMAPLDQRKKHKNKPRAFDEEKFDSIINHIRSFRGRQSHYTLKDFKKLYLPEDLNLSKMYSLHLGDNPGQTCSRESYRQYITRRVFVEKLNVSFGYPRKDTCSTCDFLKAELSKDHPPERERELHWRKG
ncbi:vitamin B12-dependent ribonucleotide reductase [Plakobranchus ocellatus]|uniref:Vitamin B12-dependent ribonucleotide reductase n=1 Tax=Plakobranchus ocellatus TaxID=259542 RepID=A0AAV3ZP37_9GAST|nr:vitamin B12-dependent ribonucleotide reductase [Plakobranchus ocellatus]